MATNYPTSLDTGSTTLRTDITATTELDDVGFYHDEQHVNAHGAVIAVETKLGVGSSDASAAGAGTVLVHSGSGSTGWSAAATGVTSVGTLSSLTVSGDVTVDTDTLHVDSTNNRVGIGTSGPNSLLEVSSATGTTPTTPTEIRISTSTDGGSWSTTSPWGQLSFYSADTSNGGAKVQAAVAATPIESFGGLARLGLWTHDGSLQERLSITHTGNVGIGTTSPAEPLHVATTSGDAYLRQENGTATTYLGPDSANTGLFGTSSAHDVRFITSNTERMRIDSSGNVGIGSTNPDSNLQVSSASTLKIRVDDATYVQIANASSSADVLELTSYGSMEFAIDSNNNSTGKSFTWRTNGEHGAGTALMTLTDTGKVGIGTTSPTAKLDIQGDSGDTWTTNSWRDSVRIDNGGILRWAMSSTHVHGIGQSGNNLYFARSTTEDGSSAAASYTMMFDSSGRVGINTTSPSYNIDVNGAEDTAARININSANTANRYVMRFSRNNSVFSQGIYCDTATAYFGTPSDVNLKTDIETIPTSDALTSLNQLRAVHYRFLLDTEDVVRKGFIAQEVEQILPEAVHRVGGGHPTSRLTLDENGDLQAEATDENGDPLVQEGPDILLTWEPITTTVVGAVQELSALVTTLTARIEALEVN